MKPIADTSAWIDYLNNRITPAAEELAMLVRLKAIAVGDLVLVEVLQGLRAEQVWRVERIFDGLETYNMVGPEIARKAAANYRYLRSRGITVRKTVDCLIATFCIENDVALLHADRDYGPFAEHLGLRIYPG